MSLNMDSAKNKRVHVVALKSSATQRYFLIEYRIFLHF